MHIRERVRTTASVRRRCPFWHSIVPWGWAAVAILLLVGRAALCAEPAPATTPAQTFPLAPKESAPAQSLRPGFGPPSPAEPWVTPGADKAPVKSKYTLVLPLSSPLYTRAAEAVKQGFLAAAAAVSEQRSVTIFAHGETGVIAAYDNAIGSGAKIIVGPLLRDDLKQVLVSRPAFPLTLALNQIEEGERLPRNVFTFGLAIESEGRQLAHLLRANGMQRVAIIVDQSPLQQRLQNAFTREWERLGGQPAGIYPYLNDPASVYKIKEALAKSGADCLLLALDNEQARGIRAYLSEGQAYAGSQVFDGMQSPGYHELNQVKFIEMPWLVQPDHAAVMVYRRPNLGDLSLERLYALGIDAFRLAYQLAAGDLPQTISLDGVTGRVFLGAPQQFTREGVVLQIRDGQAAALDMPR